MRFGKAAQPVQLTQCGKLLLPARQNFMNIRLMPYIPDDFILRQIKAVFQRNR